MPDRDRRAVGTGESDALHLDPDHAMGAATARRLKVFQAQFGFYDTVVAAPSQAAALRAWGIHQNLFASGDANEITDATVVAAALEYPETPLRRAVGSNDTFQLEPANLPKVPKAPKRLAGEASKAVVSKPASPPADRAVLDAAEASLRALDQARTREEAGFRERQATLDAAKAKAQSAYAERRKAATGAIVQARQAYRSAGGKD